MFKDQLEQLSKANPGVFELIVTHEVLTRVVQDRMIGEIGQDVAVYLCGPTPMMEASKEVLAAKGVSVADVVTEDFATTEATLEGDTFVIHHGEKTFVSYQSETILEASRRNEMTLPHACGMGQCGSCKAKLVSGDVVWKQESTALLANEKEACYILTCMCHPRSSVELAY